MGEGMDATIVENRPVYEGIGITSTLFVDGADSTVTLTVILYPDYDRYYTVKLSEYRKKEVLDMIESYETSE